MDFSVFEDREFGCSVFADGVDFSLDWVGSDFGYTRYLFFWLFLLDDVFADDF